MAVDLNSLRTAAEASLDSNMQTNWPLAGPDDREQWKKVIAEAAVAAANAVNPELGGGGGTKKILYAAQYPTTGVNASTYPFTYWISFFDYAYFYSNASYSYEATRNMPIPGPGNVVKVFLRTGPSPLVNTKTAATDFQLRMNGADVVGASFQTPAGAPADTIYEATGSWPYNDGDEMCLRMIPNSTGNHYTRSVGIVVEV